MLKHRNSQKRIVFEDACYFVTFYTKHRFPYFKESLFCDLFIENLRLCKQLKKFLLYGWPCPGQNRPGVVVYDHLHLLFQPNDEFDISKVMFSIKKQFSHDVNRVMGFNKSYPLPKAGKRLPAFGRGDGYLSDDIQRTIIKHQNYVNHLAIQFKQKFNNQNPYPKFKWQDRFHDHYIRNDWDFNDKTQYIAWNPTKHNLPSGWPYVYTNPKFENLCDEC